MVSLDKYQVRRGGIGMSSSEQVYVRACASTRARRRARVLVCVRSRTRPREGKTVKIEDGC